MTGERANPQSSHSDTSGGPSGQPSHPRTASVVICSYTLNRWATLESAVAAVRGQHPRPDEIIVVADHAPDVEDRARSLPEVRVVASRGRQGLSGARNTGVEAATGEIIVFLDDDAVPQPGWLAALLSPFEDPTVAGVGGRAEPIWEAGRRPSWFPDEFDWVVGCSYRGLPLEPAEVRNPLGCSMAFRREIFAVAGGFRSELGRVGGGRAGGEETEFCIRASARRPGARFWYAPDSVVRHHVPAGRARWRYFFARCYAEGVSKAVIARVAGPGPALANERRHAMRTVPAGIIASLADAIRLRRSSKVTRAGASAAGLALAVAGYSIGRIAPMGPMPAEPTLVLDR
jgi:GT2 family glycosyltransferase